MMFVADIYLFSWQPGILRQPQILCYVYLCICDTCYAMRYGEVSQHMRESLFYLIGVSFKSIKFFIFAFVLLIYRLQAFGPTTPLPFMGH